MFAARTTSGVQDRFKGYDDVARAVQSAQWKQRLTLTAYSVAVVAAIISLVVFGIASNESEETEQQTNTPYFHFIITIAILTIINTLFAIVGAIIAYARCNTLEPEDTAAMISIPVGSAAIRTDISQSVVSSISIPTGTGHALKALPSPLPLVMENDNTDSINSISTSTRSVSLICKWIAHYTRAPVVLYLHGFHLALSIMIFVMYFVALIAQSAHWNTNIRTTHRVDSLKYWFITTTAVNTVATAILSLTGLDRHWQMPAQFSRSVLFFSSLLSIGLSIVIIILNMKIALPTAVDGSIPLWCFNSMQWMGVYCLVTGCHGLFITFTVQLSNKERRLYYLLIRIFTCLSVGAAVSCVIFTATLLVYYAKDHIDGNAAVDQLINTDPPIACGLCVLSIVSIIAASYLLSPPSSGLRVESVDLQTTSPELLSHWAKLIDVHNHNTEGLTGAAAIELMKLYTLNTLSTVHCVVLRIRRAPVSDDKNENHSRLLLKRAPEAVGADFECVEQDEAKLDRERALEARLNAVIAAALSPNMSTNSPSFSFPLTPTPKTSAPNVKELKKLAKKERKKHLKAIKHQDQTSPETEAAHSLPPHLRPEHGETAAQRAADKAASKAAKKMISEDDTEALVMLTVVDEYDVTLQVKGWFGKVLARMLGSGGYSFFRPLVLRLGLIAFQWPFRTSLFFMQPSPHPAARAAACLRALIEWNEVQSARDKCDIMLLPAMKIQTALSNAIDAAGFFQLDLPPSHMQDMRWHIRANTTWNDYLKTLNRTHRKDLIQSFCDAGGQIIESSDMMNETAVNDVYRLWKNIATRRTEDLGEMATFASPNPSFLGLLTKTLSIEHRSFLFLVHNGEVVASCVLFKYPNKVITSDMQGLDHAKAKPLRAYFVMMQWVVRYALEHGYNFVDFGPTTGQAKMDMGCAVYGLAGGGYARNLLIGYAMKTAAHKVAQSLATAAKGSKRENEMTDVITLTLPLPLPERSSSASSSHLPLSPSATTPIYDKNRIPAMETIKEDAKNACSTTETSRQDVADVHLAASAAMNFPRSSPVGLMV